MIGPSVHEYIFIRACIFFLHWVAPLSVLYTLVTFVLQIHHYRFFWLLEAFIVAETAFYFLIYLPRKNYLQTPATHPSAPPREERRRLFRTCHENVPDPENYLSKWFLDAPLSEIKRDNVKDFLRWAFLNKEDVDPKDDEELDEYVNEFEQLFNIKFEPGRGNARCLTLTVNPVDMLHRSILWYLVRPESFPISCHPSIQFSCHAL